MASAIACTASGKAMLPASTWARIASRTVMGRASCSVWHASLSPAPAAYQHRDSDSPPGSPRARRPRSRPARSRALPPRRGCSSRPDDGPSPKRWGPHRGGEPVGQQQDRTARTEHAGGPVASRRRARRQAASAACGVYSRELSRLSVIWNPSGPCHWSGVPVAPAASWWGRLVAESSPSQAFTSGAPAGLRRRRLSAAPAMVGPSCC